MGIQGELKRLQKLLREADKKQKDITTELILAKEELRIVKEDLGKVQDAGQTIRR